MRPLLRCLILSTSMLVVSTVFADSNSSKVEDEVRLAQASRVAATLKADTGSLNKIYADELVYTHSDGRVDDKWSLLGNISSGAVNYESIKVIEQDIRTYGLVGIITGSAAFRVIAREQINEMTLRFTSIYVYKNERWQFVSWHSTRIS